MITLSSLDELTEAKEVLATLKKEYPGLFEKFQDMINLTRAFQFKYHYMGCLIMGEDPGEHTPKFVYGSVLRLYKRELQKLVTDADIEVLKQMFTDFKSIGYSKISQLILGHEPESLVGSSSIQ
ncbi:MULTISPECIES: hypothetical protein [Bacillus]|uniref:Uncharacterized protein n=1 Tax=Bacillus salipaludis TaxID=2547811 RepID=A0A4R5VKT0_9BACI|nr:MULTISPECIES: hypothetical protein [Bacillus]MDQ6595626.1 hypothetical protein [Bacillus salipaludis]TDK58580.1 hypothetical protein E2K98_22260 [Bacillus salipaludis]